jgi:hypothetical protein
LRPDIRDRRRVGYTFERDFALFRRETSRSNLREPADRAEQKLLSDAMEAQKIVRTVARAKSRCFRAHPAGR